MMRQFHFYQLCSKRSDHQLSLTIQKGQLPHYLQLRAKGLGLVWQQVTDPTEKMSANQNFMPPLPCLRTQEGSPHKKTGITIKIYTLS